MKRVYLADTKLDWMEPTMTLKEWKEHIETLIAEHGENAVLTTESGGNKCQMILEK